MWVSRLSSVGWVFSPDSDFAGDPEDFENQLREESHVSLEVEHSSPLVGCVRKQTSVSHSSTESEIISLDAGPATGWIICSGFMGRGDGSVTFVEQYQTTNQSPQQETVRAITNPTRNKIGSEMLISCRVWATLPQTHTLLKVSLSCTILKTPKLWSKWWLRAEVQQWDTWHDHHKKLHTWWVGPSSSSVKHHESLSAFPQPLSFKAESKVSSPREFKKVLWKRGRQWRSRDYEFCVKEPLECEERSYARFGWSKQPGKIRNWIRVRRETDAVSVMIPRLDTDARRERTIVLSCSKSEDTDWREDTLKKFKQQKREFFWNRRKDSVPKFP